MLHGAHWGAPQSPAGSTPHRPRREPGESHSGAQVTLTPHLGMRLLEQRDSPKWTRAETPLQAGAGSGLRPGSAHCGPGRGLGGRPSHPPGLCAFSANSSTVPGKPGSG